jgi:NADH dehydrogenase
LPGEGPVAKQQGAHVAKVIASKVTGGTTPAAFVYKDAGQLAMVGRSSAIADLNRVKLKGFVAWVLWSVVHLFFLIGARNRLAVYLNWVWAWITYGRGARLITRHVLVVTSPLRQSTGRMPRKACLIPADPARAGPRLRQSPAGRRA